MRCVRRRRSGEEGNEEMLLLESASQRHMPEMQSTSLYCPFWLCCACLLDDSLSARSCLDLNAS